VQHLDAVLRDLRAAAELVAAGDALSVRVSGLPYGDQLLPAARAIAGEVGVDIEPIWWSDDVGCDLLVRSVRDASAAEAPDVG